MKKLVLLNIIVIISCSSPTNDISTTTQNTNNYSQYISQNSINTDINFMPEEVYTNSNASQSPTLKLKLITVNQYPCANYSINTTTFLNGNELIVRFNQIIEPSICLTAIGPAITYIDLPLNTNQLTLLNGNVIDKYSVTINNDIIVFTLIQSHFTTSLYDRTFRIPLNSFAYVCGTNTTNTNIYNDFLTILQQNTNFTEHVFNGVGRIPYPVSSSGHWVNHPARYFIYNNSANFQNLDSILNNFSTQNIVPNSGCTIAIYGWDNTNYYSWD